MIRAFAACAAALTLTATFWATGALAQDATPGAITEAQVRAEYERVRVHWTAQVAGQKEYDVRHILLPSRSDADAALARIAKGERFEDVAREVSKDPGSAAKGGALGWSLPVHFAEPFAKAMTELGPAGLSREPVRTPFGWHVIEVLGVRDPVFPPYEELKDRVRLALERSRRPAPDVGLSCNGPAATFPTDFSPPSGFASATVVVRGEVTSPAGAIGQVVVDSSSGHAALDAAAVQAFRAMTCSTRAPLPQAVWVRRSYIFNQDAKP